MTTLIYYFVSIWLRTVVFIKKRTFVDMQSLSRSAETADGSPADGSPADGNPAAADGSPADGVPQLQKVW